MNCDIRMVDEELLAELEYQQSLKERQSIYNSVIAEFDDID